MRNYASWRRELALHGLNADQIDELEDHAACARERLIDAGLDPECAARMAHDALGTSSAIALEYRKVHAMPRASRLLAILASVAVVAAVSAPPQSLVSLLDVPSLLLVAGFVCAGLCASFGLAPTVRALRDVLLARGPTGLAPTERELHLAVVRRGYRLAWVSGGLGALAGVIRTLTSLSDPSELGAAAAVGLLSVLYGAVLAEVAFANAEQWLAEPAAQHVN